MTEVLEYLEHELDADELEIAKRMLARLTKDNKESEEDHV